MIVPEGSRLAVPSASDPAHPGGSLATLKIFQTIAALGGVQITAMALNLIRSKVVAVTLGPSGVGAIGLVDQVTTLVAYVIAFSLPMAAVKFLSASHSES